MAPLTPQIKWDSIPLSLKRSIIIKFSSSNYVRLLRINKAMHRLCQSPKYLIPIYCAGVIVSNIGNITIFIGNSQIVYTDEYEIFSIFRLVSSCGYVEAIITQRIIKIMRNFADNTMFNCEKFFISSVMACNPEDVQKFIKMIKPKSGFDEIGFARFLPRIIHPFTFENGRKLTASGTDYTDTELLQVKMREIELYSQSTITTSGVNLFLKQWLRGERELVDLRLHWAAGTLTELLDDLPTNLLYDKSSHKKSLLGGLQKINEKIARRSYFLIWRPSKIQEKIFLRWDGGTIQARLFKSNEDPIELLFADLTKIEKKKTFGWNRDQIEGFEKRLEKIKFKE